jgi:hypothetical protein
MKNTVSNNQPALPAAAYDVFFPRKHPSGFPSMSHHFPRVPFFFSLGRGLNIQQTRRRNGMPTGARAIGIATVGRAGTYFI